MASNINLDVKPFNKIELKIEKFSPTITRIIGGDAVIPAGGLTDEVLAKNSDSDFDFKFKVIDKEAVGLGNVDNTSDIDKPISTATGIALAGKAESSTLNQLSEDLTEALDSKLDQVIFSEFADEISEVLDEKADTGDLHAPITTTDTATIAHTLVGQALSSNLTSGVSDSINSALQPTDNISELTNDVGYITTFTETDPVWESEKVDYETATQLNTRDTNNRARANHTGTQLASTISDFDGAVSLNADVTANTADRHDIATAGTGISITGQEITNSDTGSSAVTTHETTYDHTLIDTAVQGVDTNKITVSATEPLSPAEGDIWVEVV